ncbi:MAG: MBL fold metallo-hydrolase [Rhizobacter sp.]|nr:MBL fold metallo-hydrolase [Chlorobiales bacterium]
MNLTFIGAAEGVTGSSHLLEVNGKKILLDCGLYQGKRAESEERNRNFLFKATDIDVVVLSHAHTDHSGNLPQLVKNGFTGNIFCTQATRDLAAIMLQDSAFIQEKDAEFISKRNKKKNLPAVEPLYTIEDAQLALESFISLPYHKPLTISEGVELTFFDSGHILGSSTPTFTLKENGKTIRFAFTGDLGRPDTPIIRDPEPPPMPIHYLITESTYGNRLHKPKDEVEKVLSDILQRTVKRGGKILIPAFSVGRTQEMIYFFHKLKEKNLLLDLPIYIDSPLAIDATNIYRLHPECFDTEMRRQIAENDNPLKLENVIYVRTVAESKKLNELKSPCIILAGSGMAEGGRIRHHLANNISNPANTVLIVGYMAENTLGRRILEKEKTVNIFGEAHELNAEVVVMNNFSAHADRNELLSHIGKFDKKEMRKIFIVHGEDAATHGLQQGLTDLGFSGVEIPKRGQTFELV